MGCHGEKLMLTTSHTHTGGEGGNTTVDVCGGEGGNITVDVCGEEGEEA